MEQQDPMYRTRDGEEVVTPIFYTVEPVCFGSFRRVYQQAYYLQRPWMVRLPWSAPFAPIRYYPQLGAQLAFEQAFPRAVYLSPKAFRRRWGRAAMERKALATLWR
jgi:hypothetical protein